MQGVDRMKKKLVLVLVAFLCVTLLVVNFFYVRISSKETGTARYIYRDKNISTEISREDMNKIVGILNGKTIDPLILPACGFDENIAVVINGKTFCVACDECGTVYYKEHNGYISLDDNENEQLRNILSGYGFEWPCV